MKKQIQKIIIFGVSVFLCLFISSSVLASEVSGTLNTGLDTGLGVDTENCTAVAHGTFPLNDYPTCTLTCNSGYTKSGNTCVSAGGGGGGSVSGSRSSSSNKSGDINTDSHVNEYDFALLMFNWGKTGKNSSDLNNNSIVDVYDFSLLMFYWGL